MLFQIICPFHYETRPSCTIYEDGHFYCFGCRTHGRIELLLSYMVGMREAYRICSDGAWRDFLRMFAIKTGRETFDPGPEVPWDPSHPALKGVRVGLDTLASLGAKLRANCLELVGRLVDSDLDELYTVRQYRLGKGLYLTHKGTQLSGGLVRIGNTNGARPVLVEGILDAYRLRELGYTGHVYVLMGSYLSVSRMKMLYKLMPLLMLDNDQAGRKISSSIREQIPVLEEVEYEGEDPQEIDRLPEILLKEVRHV